MTMLLSTILVLAASCVSALSFKCCVPDQWEGVLGLTEGLVQSGQPAFVKVRPRGTYTRADTQVDARAETKVDTQADARALTC